MNTINNLNTKHYCNDCKNVSLNACKNGKGNNILPCYILRKIANKCTSIYNICYKNDDNMIPDFYLKVSNWCDYGVKYLDNLELKKDLIMLAMSYVVNEHRKWFRFY